MRVTTWTEYAVIIALHLARRQREGLAAQPAREIADTEGLPGDYTEQILLRLRRAGLVESIRGAKGGYFLARGAEHISVRDIMGATDRQTLELKCETHPVAPDRCDPAAECAIRPVWQGLQQRVDHFLGSITLADLLRDEVQVKELVALG